MAAPSRVPQRSSIFALGVVGGAVVAAPGPAGAASSVLRIGVIEPENTAIYNAPDEVAAVKAAGRGAERQGWDQRSQAGRRLLQRRGRSQRNVGLVREADRRQRDLAQRRDRHPRPPDGPAAVRCRHTGHQRGRTVDRGDDGPDSLPAHRGIPSAEAAEVALAAKEGLHKVYMVANSGNSFVSTFKAAIERAGPRLQLHPSGRRADPLGAISDDSPYAQKIIASGADVVTIPLGITQAIPLMQATRALGSKVQFIINSGAFTPSDLQKNKALTNGLLIANDVPPVTSATEKAFPAIKTFVCQDERLQEGFGRPGG